MPFLWQTSKTLISQLCGCSSQPSLQRYSHRSQTVCSGICARMVPERFMHGIPQHPLKPARTSERMKRNSRKPLEMLQRHGEGDAQRPSDYAAVNRIRAQSWRGSSKNLPASEAYSAACALLLYESLYGCIVLHFQREKRICY